MIKIPYKFPGNYKALKLFPLLVLIVSIIGCNPNLIPVKGKYLDIPTEITSNKSADTTWLKISDLFVAKGLKVKSIDKNKGLIITKNTSFISAYTFEDKDGQLEEPQAWVVLPKVFLKKKQWFPRNIYSKWTIQISEITGGKTMVKVDPIVICNYHPNAFTTVEIRGQSTGTLESLIKNSID